MASHEQQTSMKEVFANLRDDLPSDHGHIGARVHAEGLACSDECSHEISRTTKLSHLAEHCRSTGEEEFADRIYDGSSRSDECFAEISRSMEVSFLAEHLRSISEEEFTEWIYDGALPNAAITSVISDRLEMLEGIGSMALVELHGVILFRYLQRARLGGGQVGPLIDIAATTLADEWIRKELHRTDFRLTFDEIVDGMVDTLEARMTAARIT